MIALPRQLFENRPIATMNFHEKQVNDYGQWGKHHERGEHNFDRLYPELKDNGAYSEWAWGFSRLLDGLELLGPEITKIDMKRIGVTGCSYAGKMALYCGAFDERVALTIAQEPGGGGAAAWRISHLQNDVENIDRTDYHWFMESQLENFRGDSVYQLPYDQHELCALVCPRALLLLGNPDYKWLADDAMLVSAQAARKVWARFGIADRMVKRLDDLEFALDFFDGVVGIGEPEDDGGLAVESGGESVQVFDVDLMPVENFQHFAEASGGVVDFDRDDVGDLDGELVGFEEFAGLFPVADQEAQHAEELAVAERERRDVDPVVGQEFERGVDRAGLVFDEEGNLFEFHSDVSCFMR